MDLYGCNNYSSRLWNELKPKIDTNGRQEIFATEEIRCATDMQIIVQKYVESYIFMNVIFMCCLSYQQNLSSRRRLAGGERRRGSRVDSRQHGDDGNIFGRIPKNMSILILFQLAIHQDTDEEDIAVYITGTAEGNRSALTLIRFSMMIEFPWMSGLAFVILRFSFCMLVNRVLGSSGVNNPKSHCKYSFSAYSYK